MKKIASQEKWTLLVLLIFVVFFLMFCWLEREQDIGRELGGWKSLGEIGRRERIRSKYIA